MHGVPAGCSSRHAQDKGGCVTATRLALWAQVTTVHARRVRSANHPPLSPPGYTQQALRFETSAAENTHEHVRVADRVWQLQPMRLLQSISRRVRGFARPSGWTHPLLREPCARVLSRARTQSAKPLTHPPDPNDVRQYGISVSRLPGRKECALRVLAGWPCRNATSTLEDSVPSGLRQVLVRHLQGTEPNRVQQGFKLGAVGTGKPLCSAP